ncbi:MAG: sulfur carrier protein ThiS [Planctomycetota bacterium]|nr:sulfur carrier protein ThiS [Planctomycetota bacterium]
MIDGAANILVTVNGESRSIPEGESLSGLLLALGIRDGAVAVELNRALVARQEFSNVKLKQGDVLEIVTFVGGG